MNIKNTKRALKILRDASLVPLLVGQHGVGKSSIVKQFAQDNGLELIDLRLGLMEPGDLIGLPDLTGGVTRFIKPAFLPTSGKGVLFLDELNRATRPVLQAVFQLILDRKIHDYVLPEGWSVVGGINPASEDYVVTDLADEALLSRFVHIEVTPELAEFGAYHGENESIVAFIRQNPGMLRKTKELKVFDSLSPCDRSWEFVSRIKNADEDIRTELFMGIVGVPAALAFEQFLKSSERLPTGEEIVAGKGLPALNRAVAESRFDAIGTMRQSLEDEIKRIEGEETDAELQNIKAFMLGLPADFYVAVYTSLPDEHKLLKDYTLSQRCADAEYAALLNAAGATEVAAPKRKKKTA